MTHPRKLSIVLVLGLAVVVFGCKGKKPATTPEETATVAAQTDTSAPPPAAPAAIPEETTEVTAFGEAQIEVGPPTDEEIMALNRSGVLRTVYFAFDSYELDDPSRAVLQANAGWLRDNARFNVRVEGHCDERGTIEYNLALGERRASAVRDYLVSLGVDAYRIRIVSFGEEQPVDPGHTESAWARNRRGEFWLES